MRRSALVILALAVAFVGWLGFSAWSAKSNLEQARQSAQQVKDAIIKGDSQDASARAQDSLDHAVAARNATHSPPWNAVAGVPFLGTPFKAVQQMSGVVSQLAADLLKPAAQAGIGLSPSSFYSDGRVDLKRLSQQESELSTLAAAASKINAEAEAIPAPDYLSPVISARLQLQKQTADITKLLQNSSLASRLAPSMLGGQGPRTYLMAFQTNAEARGTGGLLGGFGILRFNDGKSTVDTIGTNTKLDGATATVDLGQEFKDQYGWANVFTDWRNSNLSSHFPNAAQIWKSMWERQSGVTVDGVIGIDPVALSYILGAIGPVTMPDGEVITQDNVVELTESTAYTRFATDNPEDNAARKKYLQDVAYQVAKKMTGKIDAPRKLLDALGRAAGERRIAVWSANPSEQTLLEETPLGHAIPDDAAPYAEVVINNLGGNKMDYYLTREIEYAADGCSGDMRNSTVTVKLANTVQPDAKLPNYVAGAVGLAPGLPFKVPPGSMVTSVKVLVTKGARLVGVTSNGSKISAVVSSERGHPSYEVQLAIPPGQGGELSFQLSEPTSPGAPRVPVQPLVDNPLPVVLVPRCS